MEYTDLCDVSIGKGRWQDEGRSLSLASSAVLVLCLNLDSTTTLLTSRSCFPSPPPREKPRASSMRQSGRLHLRCCTCQTPNDFDDRIISSQLFLSHQFEQDSESHSGEDHGAVIR